MEGEKKKTKLKKMKITSVDMVRRGANQDAHVTLYKNEEGHPADTEPPVSGELPQGLMQTIVDAVKKFWSNPEAQETTQVEVEKAEEPVPEIDIQKGITDYTEVLYKSIDSILNDDEHDSIAKSGLIDETLNQFTEACKAMCATMLNASQDITKATDDPEPADDEEEDDVSETIIPEEGEGDRDMKIDKSKFTPEELSQYEALIAKGLVEDDDDPAGAQKEMEGEEMEKELHPEVKKAIAELEAMKKSMAMDQMKSIAKKYEPLGKKADELAATLYDMKKSGDSTYNEYIAVLDQNLDLVNKSGMFEEIGKSSRGISGGSTVEKIETIASEIQKSEPTMSRPQAIDKAWEQHPELVAEYDREYMGGR